MERHLQNTKGDLTEIVQAASVGYSDEPEPEFVTCDSCQLLRINGVICHEIGCRNNGKRWEGGAWVRYLECRECGYELPEGEVCDCQRPTDEEDVW